MPEPEEPRQRWRVREGKREVSTCLRHGAENTERGCLEGTEGTEREIMNLPTEKPGFRENRMHWADWEESRIFEMKTEIRVPIIQCQKWKTCIIGLHLTKKQKVSLIELTLLQALS